MPTGAKGRPSSSLRKGGTQQLVPLHQLREGGSGPAPVGRTGKVDADRVVEEGLHLRPALEDVPQLLLPVGEGNAQTR